MEIDVPDVACPDCGATVKVKLDDVARQRTVRCSQGHAIDLVDKGGGAGQADKALKDLEKSLKGLGGTFKIG